MEDEIGRYATFAAFPESCPIAPTHLSEAGFHYEGNEDEVVCHSCGLKYKNWQRGDNPLTIHRQKSPECDVVCNTNENLTVEEINHCSGNDSPRNTNVNVRSVSLEPRQTNIPPRYPAYAAVQERLLSFERWPHSYRNLTPNNLATAGFFYTGTVDVVRCFSCGGCLKEWMPDDDPFTEHARWFPSCPFLKQCKSERRKQKVTNPSGTKHGELQRSEDTDTVLFDHPAVLSVIEMGYTNRLVKKAIAVLQKRDRMDLSAENLLSIIFEIELVDDYVDELTEQEETNKGSSNNGQCTDIPEDTEELLDHAAVQSIQEMGYSKEQILEAIDLLRSKREAKFTARGIMECLLYIEEEAEKKEEGDEMKKVNLLERENQALQEENQALREENQALRERTKCKVCLDEEGRIVFLPCGHLVTCPGCASALRKCPVCRTVITTRVKCYLS